MRKFVLMMLASALFGGAAAWGVVTYMGKDGRTRTKQETTAGKKSDDTFLAAFRTDGTPVPETPDLTYAAEHTVAGVVYIENVQKVKQQGRSFGGMDPFFEFFGIPQGMESMPQEREQRGSGSGVIISQDGYIVTNNHVVEDASKLSVVTSDGKRYDAEVVGTDPTTDIALVKIEADGLTTIAFGSSDDLRLGEWVLAVGNPLGLTSTVTAGIVSAKGRNLDVIPSQFRIESFIQTDAAVNPGNSGGALVNARGELVGINTVIKSPTGSYAGYSFAVPSSIVKKVVVDLKEYGVVQRALLGVSFMEINPAMIERYGEEYGLEKDDEGLYVGSVSENGAAAAAGIRKGDIIIGINGEKITKASQLQETIGRYRPNDKVRVKILRGSNEKEFEVTLLNRSGKAQLLEKNSVDVVNFLGGEFRAVTPKQAKSLGIDHGVQVVRVGNGLLARANVKEGYIITHINDRAIESIDDLNAIDEEVESIDGIYPNGRRISYAVVK